MRLVVFDLDGTLTLGASAERRFIRYLLRRGRLGPRQLAAMSWFALRHGATFGRHVFKKDKAYLYGLGVGDVARLARAFVEEELLGALYAPACERLAGHRRDGDAVALLTGTPQFIADPLARHLGADHVWATRCHVRRGRFSAAPPARHPFGAEKLRLGREMARQVGLGLDAATAYADSGHDIALLSAVAEAVAVCPDKRLRGIAEQRGWEVLEAPAAPATA